MSHIVRGAGIGPDRHPRASSSTRSAEQVDEKVAPGRAGTADDLAVSVTGEPEPIMRIHAYGRGALLVELGTLGEVLGLHMELRRNPPRGLVETVPAARTLLVSFDPRTTTPAAIASEVRGRRVVGQRFEVGAEVEIPVRYDGVDLDEVARLTSCAPADLVRRHLARTYVVALIGFAPGFYFLAGGDESLAVPRRPAPRTEVPQGAVGLAGEFTGIYPRTGPGGWQIIGRTSASLWHPRRTPSARLAVGTRVRFLDATR